VDLALARARLEALLVEEVDDLFERSVVVARAGQRSLARR
jgi:hypothetical protein